MKKLVYISMILHFVNIVSAQINSIPCVTIEVVVHDTTILVPTLVPPFVVVDTDGDGILDAIEDAACQPPISTCDTDNDGIPNRNDLDSDGDGKFDYDEGSNDLDGDGKGNAYDTDSDGDSVGDNVDTCPNEYGVPPNGCSETHDYRKIFWVHGYQGNENSWLRASDDVGGFTLPNGVVTPSGRFKALSYKADYNISQQNLGTSAANLQSDIYSTIPNQVNTSKNFIIAHSLGGLVSRTLGNLNNPIGGRAYNGLITFGTPHQGIYAANTLTQYPEKINGALTKACKDLGAGPVKEGENRTGVVGSLGVLFGVVGGVLNYVCEGGVGIGFPLLASFASTGIEGQLTTDAAQSIASMATDNNAVFFGIETSTDAAGDDNGTLTPRLIGSTLNNPNNSGLYNSDGLDMVGINTVAKQLNFYVGKMNTFQNIHNSLCGGSCLCWSSAGSIAKGYRQGVNWFPTLDPTWKSLVGIGTYEITQTGCECNHYNHGHLESTTFMAGVIDCPADQNNGQYTVVCSPVFEIGSQQFDSDGFVLANSAMNAPGMNYPPQVMLGSNHFQMRNDSNTREAVKKIFERGINQAFFKTDFR